MTDTAGITLRTIIGRCRGLLLDFDGPVTVLFPDGSSREVADTMRDTLQGTQLPPDVRDTRDPLALLRWAYVDAPAHLNALERICRDGETRAAATSALTPGISEALHALHEHDYPVAIVSNNDQRAVDAFLHQHDLAHLVSAVCARPALRPDLMKPHRHLVDAGATTLRIPLADLCLLGDSVTDMEVSLAAGVTPVGWAKTPQRGSELRESGAAIVIKSPAELAHAL